MIAEHTIDWTAKWRQEGEVAGIRKGEAAGIRKGEAAGIRKGEAAGIRKGEAQLLLRQLRHKFGPLDSTIEERVNTTDAAQLLEWGERFVTANTLDEVFDGNGR